MHPHISPGRRGARAARWRWAFVLIACGFVSFCIAAILDLTNEQSVLASIPQVLIPFFLSLDLRLIALIIGIVCLGMGFFIQHRQHAYRRRAVHPTYASIAVYFDFENQAIQAEQAKSFARQIKARLGPGRKDMFFFADIGASESSPSLKKTYHDLRIEGFVQRDIPHRLPGSKRRQIANIVDMALALHALERGLTSEKPQHFILIAADLGYIPLLYTLRNLGHQVSIWAHRVPDRYKELQKELELGLWEFQDDVSRATPLPTPTTQPISSITIQDVIDRTLIAYDDAKAEHAPTEGADSAKTVTKIQERFIAHLTDNGNPLHSIGFRGSKSVSLWLELLVALDVRQGSLKTELRRGAIGSQEGTELIERCIEDIISIEQHRATTTKQASVTLGQLGQLIFAAQPANADELGKLREVLHRQTQMVRLFLYCAVEMDRITLQETPPQTVIITIKRQE